MGNFKSLLETDSERLLGDFRKSEVYFAKYLWFEKAS